MLYYIDEITGKKVDRLSDLLPLSQKNQCEECGTNLIDHCLLCGAPVCCPKCCAEILNS